MMPDAQGSVGQSERLPVQDSRYKAQVVYEVVMAINVESPKGHVADSCSPFTPGNPRPSSDSKRLEVREANTRPSSIHFRSSIDHTSSLIVPSKLFRLAITNTLLWAVQRRPSSFRLAVLSVTSARPSFNITTWRFTLAAWYATGRS
jgi:hypothetical protein